MKCMAKAFALAGLLLVVCGVLWVSCSPFGGASAFQCDSDEDCQGALDGRCEISTGFCSFADESCGPGGRRYGELSGSFAGQCVNGDVPTEAGPGDAPDAPSPEAGDFCIGSMGGFARPCFMTMPMTPVALNVAINTDTPSTCATVSNTTACVIAGSTLDIPAGATVTVTGSKALVLVGVNGVTINGVLDVSSKRGGNVGAAANDATCNAGTIPGARGGGAGGSYGALGGNGGGPNPGTAGAVTAVAFHGGCRGQDGHETTLNARGIGGNGGGAVYIISNGTIAIGAQGVVNASGAGGGGGQTNLAGGGGGGSGGVIGFDGPTATNAGVVFANGGGGGEGSGNASPSNPGADPVGVTPAPGGAGGSTTNGGDGGPGGAGATGTGTIGQTLNAGGGGGGGVGAIRLFGGATLGGAVSPPTS